jgi:hypothetical protein
MKSLTRPFLLVFGVVLIVMTPLANAAVTNGGFETGDTSGWALNIPTGGSANVVSDHDGNSSTYFPPGGNYFLELKTDGPGSYTKATQAITLSAGQTVSGTAAFDCKESSFFQDNAFVEILDGTGAVTATPWNEGCQSLGWGYADGPWTEWSFTAPTSGNYTISYRVANWLDSAADAYALFDGPASPPTPVPVLSPLGFILLLAALGGAGAWSMRRRKFV